MSKAEWQKVFKLATKKAKEIRAKRPNLSYPQAVKLAWKDKEVIAAKAAYKKKYPGGAKKKPAKRKPAAKRKTTTRKKPAARRRSTRKR